jgi:hypothetical protein
MPAIWSAAIGAGTSIIGGIFGSSEASKQNAQAKKNYKEQKKTAKQQARITNRYQKQAFEAEKKDYFAARQFQYDSAVRQWQYDTTIQDFRYLQDTRNYNSSVNNYIQQLTFNSVAAQMAYESQQESFNELLASQAFEGQEELVNNLVNQGRAALGQAGNSRTKAIQATLGEQGRNAAIMTASLISGARESERGLREASLQRYASDMQAAANLMIRPERLPDIPMPQMGPERTFVAPAEVLPAAVPAPIYQSTMMPLISGITSAAQSFTSIPKEYWG